MGLIRKKDNKPSRGTEAAPPPNGAPPPGGALPPGGGTPPNGTLPDAAAPPDGVAPHLRAAGTSPAATSPAAPPPAALPHPAPPWWTGWWSTKRVLVAAFAAVLAAVCAYSEVPALRDGPPPRAASATGAPQPFPAPAGNPPAGRPPAGSLPPVPSGAPAAPAAPAAPVGGGGPQGAASPRSPAGSAPAGSAPTPGAAAPPAGPLDSAVSAHARRAAAFRRWGLADPTLLPPPPPRVKPGLVSMSWPGEPGLAPVIGRVPTTDRVVFLTVDDGAEKDPRFLSLVSDLELPVSAFLTDYVSRDDYGYFRRLRDTGAGIHNHTVDHRNLRALSYEEQRAEICAQQDNLEREMGTRPRLFRPPYGNYNRDTLRAAKECGVQAVVMWGLEAWATRIDWQAGDRMLRPGDVILTHFRGPSEWGGTMNDMVRQVLRTAARQGFAVARLEDYL